MFAEKMIDRKDVQPLLDEAGKVEDPGLKASAKASILEYTNQSLKPVGPARSLRL